MKDIKDILVLKKERNLFGETMAKIREHVSRDQLANQKLPETLSELPRKQLWTKLSKGDLGDNKSPPQEVT